MQTLNRLDDFYNDIFVPRFLELEDDGTCQVGIGANINLLDTQDWEPLHQSKI
jgi:hypothetical protein